MDLPQILAGPFLRRTEPGNVCVWIVTKVEMLIIGTVFLADDAQRPTSNILGNGECLSIPLGDNLNINLVEIHPQSARGKQEPSLFPQGILLSYDLLLIPLHKRTKEPMKGYAIKLSNHPDVTKGLGISYAPYKYPTFFIPLDGFVNILHGSCRKAHGIDKDALINADVLIESTIKDKSLTYRPSSLLLTGDQIYADDVHDEVIDSIGKLGPALLGYDEKIPSTSGGIVSISYLSTFPGLRGILVKDVFTPDNKDDLKKSTARNQLMGFGDFAAMYLIMWNENTWPDKLTNSKDTTLQNLRNSIPRIRRSLANISTYMIMDDHEITDDWNINFTWEMKVKKNALGRRIVANGLAAYWAFQAWGNQPSVKTFSELFKAIIAGYLFYKTIDDNTFEKCLIAPDNPKLWSFITPTNPPIFFLDCRTRRQKNPLDNDYPSLLMSDDALQDFFNDASKLSVAGGALILVAQTPAFDVPVIERFKESDGFKKIPDSIYEDDMESWHASRAGLYKLIKTIYAIGPKSCLILSGDVHYASVEEVFTFSNKNEIPIIQFTSSSLKNTADFEKKVGLWLSNAISLPNDPITSYGWPSSQAALNNISDQSDFKKLPKYTKTSPMLLTAGTESGGGEFKNTSKAVADSDLEYSVSLLSPTNPSNAPLITIKNNLGQLVLPFNGDATFRLHGTSKIEYRYKLNTKFSKELRPSQKKLLFMFNKVQNDGSTKAWPINTLDDNEAFFFKSGMAIDADGAPNAYDPNNKSGLDFLGNAGHPGNWWGIATDNGKKSGTPLIQKTGVYAGFYISETSLKVKNRKPTDVTRNVDSSSIPYFVLPKIFLEKTNVTLGDLAMIINPNNRQSSFAIFADTGPAGKLGEGSIALGQALGIPTNLRKKNAGIDAEILIYVVFPNSVSNPAWPRETSEMKNAAEKNFEILGGIKKIMELFPELYNSV